MENNKGAIIIEGHVQGLSNTRSLGELGIPVFVVDSKNCIAQFSKYCKSFYKCPPFESDEMADFLVELCSKEGLNNWVLLPSNDHIVHCLARNHNKLSNIYKLITPNLEIINNIYDKSRLIHTAQQVGIPTPNTSFATEYNINNFNLKFPVLTKGKFGLDFYKATGKKAYLSKDLNSLQKNLLEIRKKTSISNSFTQELIPFTGNNKTISFTAFAIDGEIKTYWIGVKQREHPLKFGTATLASSIQNEACYIQSIPLVKALNYTGVCEIEYILDPRDGFYKLIEVNARTWLWVELAKKCGINYAKLIYYYLNNMDIVFPSGYKTDVYWRNSVTDTMYSILAITKGHLGMKEYLRTIKNKKFVNAVYSKEDKLPYYAYILLLPLFMFNR